MIASSPADTAIDTSDFLPFKGQLSAYAAYFERCLAEYESTLHIEPSVLSDSFLYSLNLGGKRIRPVLLFATAKMLGFDLSKTVPFAVAIEMIHTYSLIHDDLPAMDNDDFRRGKPSNHKVFGEGQAILAGDALLNTAYSVLFGECAKGEEYVRAAKYICDAAGVFGMIAGQAADLAACEDGRVGMAEYEFIVVGKTAKLIQAPMVAAAILARSEHVKEIEELAENLGWLFQITDDILDETSSLAVLGKSVGKDKKENKLTAVRLTGLAECYTLADEYAARCKEILLRIAPEEKFLYKMIEYFRIRTR